MEGKGRWWGCMAWFGWRVVWFEMRGRSGLERVLIKGAAAESAASRKRFVTKMPKLGTKLPKIVFFGCRRSRRFALLATHRGPTRNADGGEERPMMRPHSAAPTIKSTGVVGTRLGPDWGQTGARLGPDWGQHGANMGPTWGQHGANMGRLSGGAAGPASGSGGEREDDGRLTRRWFLQMTGSSFS